MYAQVIPVRRMPSSLPFLDYSVPENLRASLLIGQLVKIPFRTKVEFGVIKNIIDEEKAGLKHIIAVIHKDPFLSSQQLEFLSDISEFYKTSLGYLVKTNLLPLQKRKIDKLSELNCSLFPREHRTIRMPRPELHIFQNDKAKESIIKKILDTNGQILILVPELSGIDRIASLLSAPILSRSAQISGGMLAKQAFNNWVQIWLGEKNIVIGTRSAIFMPWRNLRIIIVDDEPNSNYKSWDMAPRFHTRDAILSLAHHHGSALHFLCHTPSVEAHFFAEHKIYNKNGKIFPAAILPTIINLKDERKSGNPGSLARDIITEIGKVSNGDVFLFINRLGSFGYVACQDCNEAIACDKCGKGLTLFKNERALKCGNCHTSHPLTTACPNCHGINFRMFGIGTQAVEEEITKLFPKKNILRIDSDKNNLEQLAIKRDKIIIGTQFAWPHIDWSRIRVMVFVDTDAALLVPEFKSAEELWLKMRDASYRLRNAELFIQTRRPEHPIFTYLANPGLFYESELRERKALGYPPFSYLVRLICGNANENDLDKELRLAYNTLSGLTKSGFTGKLIGPLAMTPYFDKGRFWRVILAKIPYKSYKQDTKLLVADISDSWKIDPNPITILNH